jgi:hypothetical protein
VEDGVYRTDSAQHPVESDFIASITSITSALMIATNGTGGTSTFAADAGQSFYRRQK